MKTRINNLFKTNNRKLKDKIFNRYGFDKKDRKDLNNLNINGGGDENSISKHLYDSNNEADVEQLFIRLNSLLEERGENADISDLGIVILNPVGYSSSLISSIIARNDKSYGIAIEFKCYDASSLLEEPYGMKYGAQYNTQASEDKWRIYNASLG